MPFRIPAVFRKHAESEVERVREFRESCDEKYEQDMDELRGQAGDEDEGMEFYADEAWLLEELRELASQMAVVGLYRVVELNIQKILRWRWPEAVVKRESLYRADRLDTWLKAELSLDIATLQGSEDIDELRLGNNAVKHEAKVSPGLARYPGWTIGEPLKNVDALFHRVAQHVPGFLGALAEEVVPDGATLGPDALDRHLRV